MRLRQCVYYAAYFYIFLATLESPKRTDSRGTLEGECLDLTVSNGKVLVDTDRDIIEVAAIERIHKPGKKFVGFIRGLGLRRGAIATSAMWVSSDIGAVGVNDEEHGRPFPWILQECESPHIRDATEVIRK